MKDKVKSIVRQLSAWAWRDEMERTKLMKDEVRNFERVPKWKTFDDWWEWYVVEKGAENGHDLRGHAYPIVTKAWDASREQVEKMK